MVLDRYITLIYVWDGYDLRHDVQTTTLVCCFSIGCSPIKAPLWGLNMTYPPPLPCFVLSFNEDFLLCVWSPLGPSLGLKKELGELELELEGVFIC